MSRSPLKFAVSLTLNGQRWALVGTDLPTGYFFYGLPPGTLQTVERTRTGLRRLHAETEDWTNAILARAVYIGAPGGTLRRLTPELVQRLADQRQTAGLRYLSAVGWIDPESERFVDEQAEPPDLGLPDLQIPAGELHRALTTVPEPTVRAAVRAVAAKSKTPPHVIWREWTISEFTWSWRVCVQDGLLQKPDGTPNPAAMTPEVQDLDLLAMMRVGLEPLDED